MKIVEEKFYDDYAEVLFRIRELYIRAEDKDLKEKIYDVYVKAVDIFEGITKYDWFNGVE